MPIVVLISHTGRNGSQWLNILTQLREPTVCVSLPSTNKQQVSVTYAVRSHGPINHGRSSVPLARACRVNSDRSSSPRDSRPVVGSRFNVLALDAVADSGRYMPGPELRFFLLRLKNDIVASRVSKCTRPHLWLVAGKTRTRPGEPHKNHHGLNQFFFTTTCIPSYECSRNIPRKKAFPRE